MKEMKANAENGVDTKRCAVCHTQNYWNRCDRFEQRIETGRSAYNEPFDTRVGREKCYGAFHFNVFIVLLRKCFCLRTNVRTECGVSVCWWRAIHSHLNRTSIYRPRNRNVNAILSVGAVTTTCVCVRECEHFGLLVLRWMIRFRFLEMLRTNSHTLTHTSVSVVVVVDVVVCSAKSALHLTAGHPDSQRSCVFVVCVWSSATP